MVVQSLGDPDGFGRYGIFDEDAVGCLCCECGWRGIHLGLHVYRAHGITAAEYKLRHGLRRSVGLVAVATRDKMINQARDQYAMNTGLQVSRDPATASQVRHRLARPAAAAAAAARDERMAVLARQRRLGRVVTCAECGAEFCPLRGARRRRFCTRSCASRYNRRRSQNRSD